MPRSMEIDELRLYLHDHPWWWKWPLVAGTIGVWIAAMVMFVVPAGSDPPADDLRTAPSTTEADAAHDVLGTGPAVFEPDDVRLPTTPPSGTEATDDAPPPTSAPEDDAPPPTDAADVAGVAIEQTSAEPERRAPAPRSVVSPDRIDSAQPAPTTTVRPATTTTTRPRTTTTTTRPRPTTTTTVRPPTTTTTVRPTTTTTTAPPPPPVTTAPPPPPPVTTAPPPPPPVTTAPPPVTTAPPPPPDDDD